mmetsp:Transcript_30947/g.77873  ORF Transcript_30947/g.77873 Transcript_30947/m.77873 type:complete len:267 (+) Transcript_30947:351-1151(+)
MRSNATCPEVYQDPEASIESFLERPAGNLRRGEEMAMRQEQHSRAVWASALSHTPALSPFLHTHVPPPHPSRSSSVIETLTATIMLRFLLETHTTWPSALAAIPTGATLSSPGCRDVPTGSPENSDRILPAFPPNVVCGAGSPPLKSRPSDPAESKAPSGVPSILATRRIAPDARSTLHTSPLEGHTKAAWVGSSLVVTVEPLTTAVSSEGEPSGGSATAPMGSHPASEVPFAVEKRAEGEGEGEEESKRRRFEYWGFASRMCVSL